VYADAAQQGILKPEDICTVDMTGKQIAGNKKRSSEALLHLEIYKARADVKSVVHCHPPHATAFAVAREPIPQCILPEVEVFWATCRSPSTKRRAAKRSPKRSCRLSAKTNIMLLANHGTVSYGETVERAYWWTEILDAYCRILMLARQLGRVSYFTEDKERELLALKQEWGWQDPRNTPEYKNCDVCANDIFRSSWQEAGVERKAFDAPPPDEASRPRPGPGAPDIEALVQAITDRVLDALAKR
jgi:L-fuculose-phosphate aldolase